MHARARARTAQRLLTESCQVAEAQASSSGTYNPITRTVEFPARSIIYDGPCMVTQRPQLRTETDPDAAAIVTQLTVRVPITTETDEIRAGDEVTFPDLDRTDIRDARWTIDRVSVGTHDILRALVVTRRTQPPSTGAPAS